MIFHRNDGSFYLLDFISGAVNNRNEGYDFKRETSFLKSAMRLLVAVTASTRYIKTDILAHKGLSTCYNVIQSSDGSDSLDIMGLYAIRNISDQGKPNTVESRNSKT